MKGQKGLKIAVPSRKKSKENEEKERKAKEEEEIRFYFVTVFHQSQVKKSEETQSKNVE